MRDGNLLGARAVQECPSTFEECLERGVVTREVCERDFYREEEFRRRVFCTCNCGEDILGGREPCDCGGGFYCSGSGSGAFCIRDGLERHE